LGKFSGIWRIYEDDLAEKRERKSTPL